MPNYHLAQLVPARLNDTFSRSGGEQLPFKEKPARPDDSGRSGGVAGSTPAGRTGDRESRYFISGQLPQLKTRDGVF